MIETRLTSTGMYNIVNYQSVKNVSRRNGTKAISTSTYSNDFIKSQPSISTNRVEFIILLKNLLQLIGLERMASVVLVLTHRFMKNVNCNGSKAISTSTYSNDFIKSQPSISTNQRRFMKNVKNIRNGTKTTPTLTQINDDIAVNNSNNVTKKKLVPLVAYGIYRPVSYYDLSEWTFRILNDYDDGYLIQIFEDCDYVNGPEKFVVSPPPEANVIIVNEKYLINNNKIHMMDLNSPYVINQKYLLKKNSE
uniref:Uncharacterized protein n=1 Tax=Wuchereria bancrofti TaxID=6293 RepID=A0AAF5PL65_WUCBA